MTKARIILALFFVFFLWIALRAQDHLLSDGRILVAGPDGKLVFVQEPESFTVTVRHDYGTVDREFEYFRFSFPDGTAVLVIGDKDLPFTKWLEAQAGKKMRLTVI